MLRDAGDYDARFYSTGCLSDKLAADFAALYRKNDGYIDDLVRGGTLGDQQVINFRSKLLWQPSDNAKVILTGEFFDQNSTTNSPQPVNRSEEHTSELQSLMRISYAVFCLKKNNINTTTT